MGAIAGAEGSWVVNKWCGVMKKQLVECRYRLICGASDEVWDAERQGMKG